MHIPEPMEACRPEAGLRGSLAENAAKGENATVLLTRRLRLYPADRARMEAAIAAEPDPELKKAYGEMLSLCLAHPAQWAWYAMWVLEDPEGNPVGDLCFKGLSPAGVTEIGYGLLEECRGCGLASEAVRAALDWAFSHPELTAVEAETDPDNLASRRVLEKCGFVPTGTFGEEGPRFSLSRARYERRIKTDCGKEREAP